MHVYYFLNMTVVPRACRYQLIQLKVLPLNHYEMQSMDQIQNSLVGLFSVSNSCLYSEGCDKVRISHARAPEVRGCKNSTCIPIQPDLWLAESNKLQYQALKRLLFSFNNTSLPICFCPLGSNVNQPGFEHSRMDAANRRPCQMAQTSRLWHKWSSWLHLYLFKYRIQTHCRLQCTFRILISLTRQFCFSRLSPSDQCFSDEFFWLLRLRSSHCSSVGKPLVKENEASGNAIVCRK